MGSFRYLRSLETYSRKKPLEASRNVGGKAARLAWLLHHRLPVPPTWVLDVRPFRELVQERLPAGHDPHSLLRLRSASVLLERAARARALILAESLAPSLAKDLEVLWRAIENDAPWGLAVRSSATCEDDDVTSMAGLASSELGVRGASELADALRRVWASALLPRALSYLSAKGVRDIEMAVVFQIVVRADAAGVAFTAPPPGSLLFRPTEMLVNATVGLGAPVVDGACASDVARIDRETGNVLEYRVADKPRALVVGEHGLQDVELDGARRRAPALAPWALTRLAEVARELEAIESSGPLDLEFAIEGDRLWLVQARPVVGVGFPDGGEEDTVWSRANVGEALPGAATPLTWSIARSFSEKGFRKAFASLGCAVPRGAPLVANVYGRFYLNLTGFMRIAAQVPGLDPKTLIDLGGGTEGEILEKQVAGISKRGFYARLPLTATRLLAEQIRLGGEVDRFDQLARRAQRSIGDIDFTILPDDALATTFGEARKLLDKCGELMLSCASTSLASHVALKTVLARSMPVGAERIAQSLTAGMGDLESAEPGIALHRVASVARHDQPSRRLIEAGSVGRLTDLPDGPLRRALADFIATYGDRAVREAELATPRWREDPTVLIAMLRSSLRAEGPDPDVQAKAVKERAERELTSLGKRLSKVEMSLVGMLVARSQRFARLRERMRTWVTRVLGMLRAIALEIDRRLVRSDPTLGSGAVFFCTFDELMMALTMGRTNIGEVVRMRRAEFARDEGRPDPPVSFVGRPPSIVLPPAAGVALRGLPASGGVVQGIARVIDARAGDSGELVAGEVLVARTTDIGLSPLFLVAVGVVTELGGPLSHAALVAREYGIPAVVNVPGAATVIKTGDLVRVDGDRGVVERLDSRGDI